MGSAQGLPLSAAKAEERREREVEVDYGGGCWQRAGLHAAAERRRLCGWGGIVKVNRYYSMFRFAPCCLLHTRCEADLPVVVLTDLLDSYFLTPTPIVAVA